MGLRDAEEARSRRLSRPGFTRGRATLAMPAVPPHPVAVGRRRLRPSQFRPPPGARARRRLGTQWRGSKVLRARDEGGGAPWLEADCISDTEQGDGI